MKHCLLVSCLLSLALAGYASPEAELEAKLPEIIAKSAAHYRALDAAATPLMKVKRKSEEVKSTPMGEDAWEYRTPHGWLKWENGKGGLEKGTQPSQGARGATRKERTGELDMRSRLWWTAGHYPGSLWYLYEATGEDFFKDRAIAWTEILAPNAKVTDNHDIGFVMYCSYGNARRLLKTDKYDALLLETANSLCQRYNEKLGLIRSWGAKDEKGNFLVIPDNLMNLELLEWAAAHPEVKVKGEGERRNFDTIARSHADVTMRHHFRPDGGCFHVLDYDQASGRVQRIMRGQGASCETAWSRGESWAIYGYTMLYRTTGLDRYLDFAKKLADYAIAHPNMPEDGIPYWDYGAPGEERDSSAGSIMASGLLELSQYVGAEDRLRYRAFAVKQLLALASPAYFSVGDEIGHFLLKHGVGHKPGGSEIDTPLDYGDYYFLEALLRFRNLRRAETANAKTAAALPPKATIPEEVVGWRFTSDSNAPLADAEKMLSEPIAETSDELYLEFRKNGNRTNYQNRFFARMRMVRTLALAERREGKGRFLPKLREVLAAVCDMKSWVLPAHDWSDGGNGTFRGTSTTTDLFSSEVGANLACVVQLLGDRLGADLVQRIRRETERRVFMPVRRELNGHAFFDGAFRAAFVTNLWWMECPHNWNAVCWDNVVTAAQGLLDDPLDRARFVDAAIRAKDEYLSGGFARDGYCTEGMGYWNYGFGHHLLTGMLLRRVSDGKIDFFTNPRQKLAAEYAFAATPTPLFCDVFFGGNMSAVPLFKKLALDVWPDLDKPLGPVTEFADAEVWIFRSPAMTAIVKGGDNGVNHNHNDIGSYCLYFGTDYAAGDPAAEVYTARTFGKDRYVSKVLNSYGHPLPVVGGTLQKEGRRFRGEVISKKFAGDVSELEIELKGAYPYPSLKSLRRTFRFDRAAGTFTVADRFELGEPAEFEDAFISFLEKDNGNKAGLLVWNVRPEIDAKGAAYTLVEEDIANAPCLQPHRTGVRLDGKVTSGEIVFTYRNPKNEEKEK